MGTAMSTNNPLNAVDPTKCLRRKIPPSAAGARYCDDDPFFDSVSLEFWRWQRWSGEADHGKGLQRLLAAQRTLD